MPFLNWIREQIDGLDDLIHGIGDDSPRGVAGYEGTWPKRCIQRAFVDGAAWWQYHHSGSTMFGSERTEAETEAILRYGCPVPSCSATMQKTMGQLEVLLTEMVGIDCGVPSEIDGDISCFYCNAYLQGGESHDDKCLYMAAKRLLAKGS